MSAVRAIVTGGAGFIGSHVVEALLARGDEVTVVDDLSNGKRENVPEGARLVERDVREGVARGLRRGAAGGLLPPRRAGRRARLGRPAGARRLGERARHDRGARGCAGARDAGRLQLDRRRDLRRVRRARDRGRAERRPLAPYGVSKLAGEEYLAAYNRLYGTRHVSLRYGNVYGPRQDPHGEAGVVAIFLGKLAAGEAPRIFGDGRQTRDYVYAGDVARATLAAAGQDGGVFNVGTGMRDLRGRALRGSAARGRLDARCRSMRRQRLGELQRSVLDVSLAGASSAGEPEVPLGRGPAPDLGVDLGLGRSGRERRRIGRSAVEHALPHPGQSGPERHHPWRTIAVVVAGVATLELLVLVVVGVALVAKPMAHRAITRAAKAPAVTKPEAGADAAAAPAPPHLGHDPERQRRPGRRRARGLARARARVQDRPGRQRAARSYGAQRRHVPRRPRPRGPPPRPRPRDRDRLAARRPAQGDLHGAKLAVVVGG